MPGDKPQWQFLIVPAAPVERVSNMITNITLYFIICIFFFFTNKKPNYYLIVRMHHLLLSYESNLNWSEMLMLDEFVPGSPSNNTATPEDIAANPLRNIVSPFEALPQLCGRLSVSLNNQWNEFVYKYDRTEEDESKYKLKPICGIVHLLSICAISVVAILRDFFKGFNAVKHYPVAKLQFLCTIIEREFTKRDLTWQCFFETCCRSLAPINIIRSCVRFVCWACRIWTITLPYIICTQFKVCFLYCFGSSKFI